MNESKKTILTQNPIARIAPPELDRLMATLDVTYLRLTECLISSGNRLQLAAADTPGMHYNLAGSGRLVVSEMPPIELRPHTLVILPPGHAFRLEAADSRGRFTDLNHVDYKPQFHPATTLQRYVAGDSNRPEIVLICGYFKASYGSSIDLFDRMNGPIVESFAAKDRLDQKLKDAVAELISQEVGSGAMSAALMKQVLVSVLRRSLVSQNLWVERFSILKDPQIARAFADMVARPGSPHTVLTLCHTSGLSRSAFMVRFREAFGASPMAILRQLRMRHAATLLEADTLSIDQIAGACGYASRSSFFRAFQKSLGSDPSQFRAAARQRFREILASSA
ncbi:MAG TPA: AraC family transcriptional regulator [Rhizomicrobium sp.]|jgi:AraC family transcriptional activator of mtrCDE